MKGNVVTGNVTGLGQRRPVSNAMAVGGGAAPNTLTPIHHSPASPVTLGGAPEHRNVGYGVIDGNGFHHKP
jgi:hypothetical protein